MPTVTFILGLCGAGGTVRYDPGFLPPGEADRYLAYLLTRIAWEERQRLFGHSLPRLTAWFADCGVDYRYSGVVHTGGGWDEVVEEIRRKVEEATGGRFNSVLLNRYRGGRDSVAWHADDEPELGETPLIASVSLGATRKFALKHKDGSDRRSYWLAHGRLLVMGATLQRYYLNYRASAPRFSLSTMCTGRISRRWICSPISAASVRQGNCSWC